MASTLARPSLVGSSTRVLAGWAVLIVLIVGAFGLMQRQTLIAELQTEATILHRLASQRADQHDAHMTSLSALAIAGAEERPDLFLDVAATILRFYPRIEAIDLVALEPPGPMLSTRAEVPDPLSKTIRAAAISSDGQLVLRALPDRQTGYLMVKRSPNSDAARYGLAMQIDTQALLFSDSAFWQRPSVSRGLRLPGAASPNLSEAQTALQFEKALGSASQPLIFQASISPGLADLVRPGPMLLAAALASLLYVAAVAGFRQLMRARRAERQAQLSAQEVRLAHASRVNALGEMASGMAHELTQPLTAVLSQAQAGRHLVDRGDMAGSRASLDSIIAQTRRASAILDRLRNWTRPRQGDPTPVSVNAVAANVRQLLHAEAERAGIGLTLDLDPAVRPVQADAVEIEQVLFNLVRNAMDAVATAAQKQIRIATRAEGAVSVLEVTDQGPGVPPDIRPRLFEPFVTGKADGTGLGLALCQRLVERMGGEIALEEAPGLTTFRVRLPTLADTAREAAE
jgi:signal transduction histidine kinase